MPSNAIYDIEDISNIHGYPSLLNFKSLTFKKKRLSINEFPCYGLQSHLDVFTSYALTSNLRGFFVPCVDCNQEYQSKMCSKGMCRYPSVQFEDTEAGVASFGERVVLFRERVRVKKQNVQCDCGDIKDYTKPTQLKLTFA